PASRAATIHALARSVARGELALEAEGDVSETMRGLKALPGIGDWTAEDVAMRALHWPDAFPATGLGLRRNSGNLSAAQLLRRAEEWRPWRAYAAMLLWRQGFTAEEPR